MKTEVKIGLGLGAILLAVIGAAVVFMPQPKPTANTTGTTGTDSSGRNSMRASDQAATSDNVVITPGAPVTGGVVPPSTMPTTLPTAGSDTGFDTGMAGMGPATQPGGMTGMAPATQPMFGAAPGGSESANRMPSGPVDWNALLAGSSTPGTPGTGNGNGNGNGGTPSGTLPPSVGPRGGTTPGAGLPPVGGSTGNTGSAGTGTPATYTVRPGDTLAKISANLYGSPNYWSKIVQANPGLNPNRLKAGQVIRIPDESEVKPNAASAPRPERPSGSALVRDPKTEYLVQAGDSLEKIATKLYGNGARWKEIYELNRSKIGSSPRNLKVGMTLKLPAAPTTGR